MEDATDPSVQSVTMMCASQLIKTTVLENIIGYFIDVDPAPILLVQPTNEMGESFSKERLAPMIRDTPALRDKVKEARSKNSNNTIMMKSFPGGTIAIVGANAPGGLAGRPRRVVLMDEVDRMPASAGTEGDPCSLAERRTETYWNSVIYKTSTPTTKHFSRIEAAFELTDKRMWFCECPRCQHWQTLRWSQVKWGKNMADGKSQMADAQIPEDGSDAVYECASCKAQLNDAERVKMVRAGEWRATAPFKGLRGYHINGICSPFKAKKGFKTRLHQMVAGFLEAKAGGRETYKTWVNTFLAETFEEVTDRVDHAPLLERGEDYFPKNLPDQIILVAASCDVQGDRIECETAGVGMADERWGIEKTVFYGDTEQDTVWQDLREHLSTKYTRDDGVELPITCTAIDMRHKSHKVRQFLRNSGLPRVYGIYGVGHQQPILVTKRFNKHYRLWTHAVATKNAKDTIYARLRVTEAGPRYMHFPKGHGYDQEHFQQLTAEVLKTKYSHGFPTQFYEKERERNEALDLAVYWLAALDILKPNLTAIAKLLKQGSGPQVTKDYQLKRPPDEEPPPIAPAAGPRKPFRGPRRPGGGGFVGGWRK